MSVLETGSNAPVSNLVAFDAWLQSINKTRVTGHRWRKIFPWLKTTNIFGRLYIDRATIAEFEARAMSGEFAKNIRPEAKK